MMIRQEMMTALMIVTIIVWLIVKPKPMTDAPAAQPETLTPDVTQKAVYDQKPQSRRLGGSGTLSRFNCTLVSVCASYHADSPKRSAPKHPTRPPLAVLPNDAGELSYRPCLGLMGSI